MKRVKCTCLDQTLHFVLCNDNMSGAGAEKELQMEVARYKQELERSKIKLQVIDEQMQPDDSIILKLKKQYNSYDVGEYLLVGR